MIAIQKNTCSYSFRENLGVILKVHDMHLSHPSTAIIRCFRLTVALEPKSGWWVAKWVDNNRPLYTRWHTTVAIYKSTRGYYFALSPL